MAARLISRLSSYESRTRLLHVFRCLREEFQNRDVLPDPIALRTRGSHAFEVALLRNLAREKHRAITVSSRIAASSSVSVSLHAVAFTLHQFVCSDRRSASLGFR